MLDACLRMLARIVHCKTDWSGTRLVEIDTWFPNSKLCSECEAKNTPLELTQRAWSCATTGRLHDGHANAATNIRNEIFQLLGPRDEARTSDPIKGDRAGDSPDAAHPWPPCPRSQHERPMGRPE